MPLVGVPVGAASPPRAERLGVFAHQLERADPLSEDELRDSVVVEVEDDADMNAVALGLFARGANRRLIAMIAAAWVVAETEVDAWRARVAARRTAREIS